MIKINALIFQSEQNSINRSWTKRHYSWFETVTMESSHACSSNVQFDRWQRWSTCPLVFSSWLLNHVIYLKLRKKELLAKLSKLTKWQNIFTQNGHRLSFWGKTVVILWIISALQAIFFFSAWDKPRDPTANWRILDDT